MTTKIVSEQDEEQMFGGVKVAELEQMTKSHPRSALTIAYGQGLLVGINRAKAKLAAAPVTPSAEGEAVGFVEVSEDGSIRAFLSGKFNNGDKLYTTPKPSPDAAARIAEKDKALKCVKAQLIDGKIFTVQLHQRPYWRYEVEEALSITHDSVKLKEVSTVNSVAKGDESWLVVSDTLQEPVGIDRGTKLYTIVKGEAG